MDKIISGRAISLKQVFDFEEYDEIYLVEDISKLRKTNALCSIDLGRKRVIHVSRDCYLFFLKNNGYKIERIDFLVKENVSLNPPILRLISYLKRSGIKVKSVARPLKRIEERMARLSSNGIYLQDRGWDDCRAVSCDLILKKGQLTFEGKTVHSISVPRSEWIKVDIGQCLTREIETVLAEELVISEEKFDKIVEILEIRKEYMNFEIKYY